MRSKRKREKIMVVSIIDSLLRGVMVGLASSITVGPVAVLCIQRTLSKNRRSGFISGLGVACADTLMAIIAYFFYAILQSQIERYSQMLTLVGGILVVVVGVTIFFKNPVPQIRKNRAGNFSMWKDFSSMFGFTIANFVVIVPYLLVFFAMFGIGMAGGEEANSSVSLLSSVAIIAGFLCGAVLWWFALTALINLFRLRFRPRHMLTINRIAGIVIGLLGAYTIISTFVEVM